MLVEGEFVNLIKKDKRIFCKVFKVYEKHIVLKNRQNKIYLFKKERPKKIKNILIFQKQNVKFEKIDFFEQTKKEYEKVSTSINFDILINKYTNYTITNYEFYLLCKYFGVMLPGGIVKWMFTSILIINKDYLFHNRYKSKEFEKYKKMLNEAIEKEVVK
jgi:hypothetical protein